MDKRTVADLVLQYPAERAEEKVLSFLNAKGEEEQSFSFRELKTQVETVAKNLFSISRQGEIVLLCIDNQADFITGFFGCILAGMIPAPLPAPRNGFDQQSIGRIHRILLQDRVKNLLISQEQKELISAKLMEEAVSGIEVHTIESLQIEQGGKIVLPEIYPASTAYIQYTSGSTSEPKGVVLRHENVIANLAQMFRVFDRKERVRVAGWIPLYHDMGLVGHLFTVLYEGGFGVLMPASTFLATPGVWLKTISLYKANSAAAPLFAFEHCYRKVSIDLSWDLSCWKYAYVGSETVSLSVLNRFYDKFKTVGFERNSFKPVYGLAESTLLVAGGGLGLDQLDGAIFTKATGRNQSRQLIPYSVEKEAVIEIYDTISGCICPERKEGEIWVYSSSNSRTYVKDNPALSTIENVPVKTGDIGFVSGGFLYITGRKKEVVIIRGVNYSAEDLEFAARDKQDLLQSTDQTVCVSYFMDERESFLVFQEVHRHTKMPESEIIAKRIKANLTESFGILPDRIILVPQGFLPRTRNHKISRIECLEKYLSGSMQIIYSLNPLLTEDKKERKHDELEDSVVIVGMACRFPGGADTPEKFWEILSAGTDVITEVPVERWDNTVFYNERPAVPGKVNTRWAGFVDQIDQFDPALFGISHYEAPELDPQQRILLETSWRLLENSGWKKNDLAGTDTGVFIGLSTNDYLYMKIKLIPGMESFNAYSGLGNANSIAANRISYFYDLKGPSLTIDTACSSSLTALHFGAKAILNGECSQAIVGGANAILSPGPTITLSQFGMMSPDGRCKTFDAGANGYVRAEGCGLVMLKRRSAAIKDGDHILAVLKASVAGQDGHSNGMTSPNGEAQEKLIVRALKEAGLNGSDISYVEAHGTGTELGDPVEMEQLGKIYGRGSESDCFVGSVKANMGHLEAAAGITSIIKSVLMLQHNQIPPQIHFNKLNPKIHIEGTRLRITDQLTDWDLQNEKKRIAISSFGFGGSLAHAILEEDRNLTTLPKADPVSFYQQTIFMVSGHSEEGLIAQIKYWVNWLEKGTDLSLQDICFSQATGRTDLKFRQFFLVNSKSGLLEKLSAYIRLANKPASLSQADNRLCFLFTGQGEHYLHMGKELYHRFPVFKQAFDRCTDFTGNKEYAGFLRELAFASTDTGLWNDGFIQPILFAVQYALGILLQESGCIPHVLLGHSFGEYAAACLAGCLEPEEAMLIIKKRAELIDTIPEKGVMATVFTGQDEIRKVMDATKVCIAAINSEKKTVISGDPGEVHRIVSLFESSGVETYALKTQQAFHSHFMDPVLDAFHTYLERFTFKSPSKKWISSVSGMLMTTAPGPEYWVRHLRNSVVFSKAVSVLANEQISRFIEIGPGCSTLVAVSESLNCKESLMLRTLNIKKGDRTEGYFFLDSIGQLYRSGLDIYWDVLLNGNFSPYLIPGQKFMHKSYWLEGLNPETVSAFASPGTQQIQKEHSLSLKNHYRPEWVSLGELPDINLAEELSSDIHWIIIGNESAFAGALTARLRTNRNEVFRISKTPGSHNGESKTNISFLKKGDKEEWKKVLDRIVHLQNRENNKNWKIVFIDSRDPYPASSINMTSLERDIEDSTGLMIPLLQSLRELACVFPLWIITESSQYVAGPQKDASGLNLSASVLWGFAKTVFLEHPEWRGGMIDIDDHSANSDFVLKKMVKPFRENCVALRNGQQFVQQLIPEKSIPKNKVHFRCDGVYIITGGLGGLGMQCAVWLTDKGVKHIILTGRRQLPEEKLWGIISEDHRDHEVIHQILALKNRGVAVEVISADIRDMLSLEKLFEGLGKREIPVRGVIHAAGVNWFSKVANLDTKAFLETLKIKVSSSWALHQLTEKLDLDCFILFSSVSALWGSVELSHYTAANHFMDMLSLYRASKGLPTCCINWGPWAETGMSSPDKEADVLKKLGFQLMPPGKALLSMEAVQASSIPLSLITDIDWQKFRMFIDFSLQPSLFSQVIGKQEDSRHVEGTLLQTILSSTPGKAKEQIEEVIRMELRSVMLIESMDNINADERFNFLGMDSLMAITFVVKLEEYFNCKLPSTLAYNYPTISTVRDFIFELIYTGGESSLNENIKMAEKSNRTKNLVLLRKSDAHGKLTLFCFPGAGSGASVYTDWSHEFSSEVELISVQLPGREGRGDEKPYTSMEGIIDELVTAFEEVTGDFCFFGHSLGSLIAYELYVKLKSLNRKLPERLFLSGCSAPLQPSSGKIHLLPDDAFIEEVMRNYPGSENEHERRNAMKHTCQLLRADLQVLETYQPGSERIDIPLMVICGVEDQLAPPAEVKKWDQLSGPDFLIAEINAGHNMVKENAQDLVLLIESLVNADFAVAK